MCGRLLGNKAINKTFEVKCLNYTAAKTNVVMACKYLSVISYSGMYEYAFLLTAQKTVLYCCSRPLRMLMGGEGGGEEAQSTDCDPTSYKQ